MKKNKNLKRNKKINGERNSKFFNFKKILADFHKIIDQNFTNLKNHGKN